MRWIGPLWTIGIVGGILLSPPVCAQTDLYSIQPNSTQIAFEVDVLGFAPSSGDFHAFKGRLALDLDHPENSAVAVDVDASSVEMGWEPADSMVRSDSYLDIGRFNHLEFATRAVLVNDDRHVSITGDLTMRGVKKPITLLIALEKRHYDPAVGADVAEFSVNGHVSRSDFGMDADPLLIGDEIRLNITSRIILNRKISNSINYK